MASTAVWPNDLSSNICFVSFRRYLILNKQKNPKEDSVLGDNVLGQITKLSEALWWPDFFFLNM
jgi:hypothetical protein